MASVFRNRRLVIALGLAGAALVGVIAVVILVVTGGGGTQSESIGRSDSTPEAEMETQSSEKTSTPTPRIAAPTATRTPIAAETGELPWKADGLNDLEQSAAESLATIEERDPATARVIKQLPWMADELTLEERLALAAIGSITDSDPELARSVVGLPWLREELTDDQLLTIVRIGDLAHQEPSLASNVVSSRWFAGGVTQEEGFVLDLLLEIASDDPSIARRIVDSVANAESVKLDELAPLAGSQTYFQDRMEREHPEIWEIISDYAWITDGKTGREWNTQSGLLASPLPVDGLSERNQWALAIIRRIADLEAELGLRVALLQWIADGISITEQQALLRLYYIAQRDPALAGQLLDLAWFADGVTELELRAVVVCWLLSGNDAGQTELLFSQSWFRDQLSEEEGALLVTLRSGCQWNPFYFELVQGGHVRSETLDRQSGVVKLFVVSRSPLGSEAEDVFQDIRTGIDAIEHFMSPPWVTSEVITYLEPGLSYIRNVVGINYGSHIAIRTQPSSRQFRDVLFHELAHFYFGYRNAPSWLAEGGANFLESYALYFSDTESISSRYDLAQHGISRSCEPQGIGKVNDLLEASASLAYRDYLKSSLWPCTYPIGEAFLLGIYIGLGHDLVSSSMRSLYEMGPTLNSPPSEEQIYWTFLSNVPEAQHDVFRDLYRTLHGGPIPSEHTATPVPAPPVTLVPPVTTTPGPRPTAAYTPAPTPVQHELA